MEQDRNLALTCWGASVVFFTIDCTVRVEMLSDNDCANSFVLEIPVVI